MEEYQIRVGVSAFVGFMLDVMDLGFDLISESSNVMSVTQATEHTCGVQSCAGPYLRQYVRSYSYNSSVSSAPQSDVLNVFAFDV